MEGGREALEGGFRMAKLRQTKMYLFAVQLALVFIIAVFLIDAAGVFSIRPFYLPLGSFIYFVILMMLLFAVENFFFRGLEMKLSKSDSSKFYMARISIKRSVMVIAVAAAVMGVLLAPFVSNAIEDSLSDEGTVDGVQAFQNRDPLGLTSTESITLRSTEEAQVYVVSEDHYNAYSQDIDRLRYFRINGQNFEVDGSTTFEFPDSEYGKFYLVLDQTRSQADAVSYTLHQDLSGTFTGLVPLLALFFIIVHAGWLSYLVPLQKRYAGKAIYR
ncbi:MAG: hypothetical protein ACLFUV_00420 [Methanomassiliicoccales archaeon]